MRSLGQKGGVVAGTFTPEVRKRKASQVFRGVTHRYLVKLPAWQLWAQKTGLGFGTLNWVSAGDLLFNPYSKNLLSDQTLCRFSMETEWSCQSISATPPTSNPSSSPSSYVASISKEGLSVYKLWKERPAFTCHQSSHLHYNSGSQV